MKNKKRILALALTMALLVTQSAGIVYADTTPSAKEEVVYANLAQDGSVSDVHVVNSFEGGGEIVDYGVYSGVRNMTTTDEIQQSADQITISTNADKLYYQGDMEAANIPWNVELTYYLNGIQCTADEVAGGTGHLRMNLNITQNKGCPSGFWEGYALQITAKLDGELCDNIHAPNATVANIGGTKQLTYIVLPGQGADLTIEADVQDFEMEAIAINGIRLNLSIDLDGTALADKLNVIEKAAKSLDKGAQKVNNGAEDLKTGANSMDKGMTELFAGIKALQKGVNTLDSKSEALTSGSSKVYEALQTIQTALDGVEATAEDLDTLSEASTKVQAGIDGVVGGLETIDENIDLFYDKLEEGGLSDTDQLIEYHEMVLDYITVTDTQRTLFQVYEDNGGLDGKESKASVAVMLKLMVMTKEGDEEASALYDEYVAAGKDTQIIKDYMTEAGAMVIVERLAKADIAYIEGTGKLIGGIDDTLDAKNEDGLMAGAKELQTQYKTFDEAIQSLVASLKTLLTNMSDLKEGIDLLVENYADLDAGITTYTDGVGKIVEGYNQIYSGAAALTTGASTLSDGAIALYEGTDKLKDGTGEFAEQAAGAGKKVTQGIQDTIEQMTGKNVTTKSFVSDKNTNVQSVQFVIKTPPIEKAAAAEAAEQPEKELTFWQKLLKLFGIE